MYFEKLFHIYPQYKLWKKYALVVIRYGPPNADATTLYQNTKSYNI